MVSEKQLIFVNLSIFLILYENFGSKIKKNVINNNNIPIINIFLNLVPFENIHFLIIFVIFLRIDKKFLIFFI